MLFCVFLALQGRKNHRRDCNSPNLLAKLFQDEAQYGQDEAQDAQAESQYDQEGARDGQYEAQDSKTLKHLMLFWFFWPSRAEKIIDGSAAPLIFWPRASPKYLRY